MILFHLQIRCIEEELFFVSKQWLTNSKYFLKLKPFVFSSGQIQNGCFKSDFWRYDGILTNGYIFKIIYCELDLTIIYKKQSNLCLTEDMLLDSPYRINNLHKSEIFDPKSGGWWFNTYIYTMQDRIEEKRRDDLLTITKYMKELNLPFEIIFK